MEHGGQLLGRDLVHIGDHEQQALGGGVGAGESRIKYSGGAKKLWLESSSPWTATTPPRMYPMRSAKYVALGQHGEAGLTAGHDVGVIAEDVQSVGGHGAGGDMEHGGQLLGRKISENGANITFTERKKRGILSTV